MKKPFAGFRYCPVPLFTACCITLLLAGCIGNRTASFAGKTMGTIYRITAQVNWRTDTDQLDKDISNRLETLNASLSTYIKTSEISRFNNISLDGVDLIASTDLATVVRLGQRLHTMTQGAWDGTIWPLAKVWGGSRGERPATLPTAEAIAAARTCVDYALVRITDDNRLSKKRPCVRLDFASIAKGYGVDQIAALLRDNGINNFIVEIGGDVYVSGEKKSGQPWAVGINVPQHMAAFTDVRRAVALSDRAIATSGDYRNFFEVDGRRYNHVLDPKTGYPIRTGVVSASVVADTCALADGLATALMVMTPADSLKTINRLPRTECLITVKNEGGILVDYSSKKFNDLILE